MLLDFNLARNWSLVKTEGPPGDLGGTLVYMAPERLRSLVQRGSLEGKDEGSDERPAGVWDDPHRSDIYSLGLVLLEGLTGASPAEVIHDGAATVGSSTGIRALAEAYARFHENGATAVIRAFEAAGRRTVPAGLRGILERCLAAEPARRFRRSLELAEDLDRWRSDLPLAYTTEHFWSQTLPRAVRRNRRPLVATGLVLFLGSVVALLVVSHDRSHALLENLAEDKLARIWDDIEAHAFQFQRPGSPHLQDPDEPELLAAAIRALKEYDVFSRGDWRERVDVRSLPESDRNELVLWLMEQAYRYCHALSDRPGSPADWRRAVHALDQVRTRSALQAMERLRHRLEGRIEATQPGPSAERQLVPTVARQVVPEDATVAPLDPPWLDDYLLGIEAEVDGAANPELVLKRQGQVSGRGPTEFDANAEPTAEIAPGLPRAAARALHYYERVLSRCPESFWGHYRAAVVCFQLKEWSEATRHLERCLRRRSQNAALRGQFAACLLQLGYPDDAFTEVSRAVDSSPDYAEFYRSRAFVRVSRGQIEGLEDDLGRFELLTRRLTRAFFRDPPGQTAGNPRSALVPASQRVLDLEMNPQFTAQPGDPLVEPEEIQPDELDARLALAATIIGKVSAKPAREDVGLVEHDTPIAKISTPAALKIADAELEKILVLDPQHVTARMERMMQYLELGRYREARNDLDVVLDRALLIRYLREDPQGFKFFYLAAQRFARYGLHAEALKLADMAVRCSNELRRYQGRSHYYKATVLSLAARSEPAQAALAAQELRFAFLANPRYKEWYQRDRLFDPVRIQVDAALDQSPEISRVE